MYKGERMAGLIHGTHTKEKCGSFVEYVAVDAELLIRIPDSLSFEDASGFPLCTLTTCRELYQSLKLPIPGRQHKDPTPLLISGGTSSVGQFVVQLATLGGHTVHATASPANHALVKSLGAAHVYSYHSPTFGQDIHATTNGELTKAVNTICERGTPELVCKALGLFCL
jgi:NADPH:quinone reductase-like Zn-dependent oxidoreductase